MIDRLSLERKTRQYWEDYDHAYPELSLELYIKNLLPDEMQYAQERNTLPKERCDILVLLVGFSIEPLLQAVWAYKPNRVLLVLNEHYGQDPGQNWGKMISRLLDKLPEPPEVEDLAIIQAAPEKVFQVLQQRVRQTEGVIIDITGAKKNMTAGAFLFAAFANVPVSYVDFDDEAYDREERRPYGWGCHIGILRNPYEMFALRDWERVRELYRRYKFRDARILLVGEDGMGQSGTILSVMREYLSSSEPAIQELVKVLRCYELWDAGLYNEAAEQTKKIEKFEPPTAVAVLGGKWFKATRAKFEDGPSDFYYDTEEFRAYVYDELARIERLISINHDYRSAFLRSGGLNEIVMTARMVMLAPRGQRNQVLKKIAEKGIPRAEWLFEQLVLGQPFKWHGIQFILRGPIRKWWKKLAPSPFGTDEGWRDFIYRRNDLAHKYYSPPREWAQDALAFIKANLEDLWGHDAQTTNTKIMPWSKLCELVGLNQYLTPNLVSD